MINKMLQHAGGADDLLAAAARVHLGRRGAAAQELYRRWKERFGVEILDGIGSAELFHIYISNRLGEVRPGSLGRLVPGYDARVVGADGNDVPAGEIGTLWVKGDSAALCYWQAHEKSKEVLRGDWVVSGDLFRRDADGLFCYAGRADDMLKVGGIFVVAAGGRVRACCAIRACSRRRWSATRTTTAWSSRWPSSSARAAPASEALAAQLIEHCKRELAHYKAPRRIEFVDALPRSDRGKILRRELRREVVIAKLAELTWRRARKRRGRSVPIVLLPDRLDRGARAAPAARHRRDPLRRAGAARGAGARSDGRGRADRADACATRSPTMRRRSPARSRCSPRRRPRSWPMCALALQRAGLRAGVSGEQPPRAGARRSRCKDACARAAQRSGRARRCSPISSSAAGRARSPTSTSAASATPAATRPRWCWRRGRSW